MDSDKYFFLLLMVFGVMILGYSLFASYTIGSIEGQFCPEGQSFQGNKDYCQGREFTCDFENKKCYWVK